MTPSCGEVSLAAQPDYMQRESRQRYTRRVKTRRAGLPVDRLNHPIAYPNQLNAQKRISTDGHPSIQCTELQPFRVCLRSVPALTNGLSLFLQTTQRAYGGYGILQNSPRNFLLQDNPYKQTMPYSA